MIRQKVNVILENRRQTVVPNVQQSFKTPALQEHIQMPLTSKQNVHMGHLIREANVQFVPRTSIKTKLVKLLVKTVPRANQVVSRARPMSTKADFVTWEMNGLPLLVKQAHVSIMISMTTTNTNV